MNYGQENHNLYGRFRGICYATDEWGFSIPETEGRNSGGESQAGTQGTSGGEKAGSETGSEETAGGEKAGSETGSEGQGYSAQAGGGENGTETLDGMGVGVAGDAPPVSRPNYAPEPAASPVAATTADVPRRRGRPPGSKNKAASANTPVPKTTAWFGGRPLNEREAAASAKVIVAIYSVPCNVAARLKKNDDFKLTAEEKQELTEAFRDYQMIRGDLLGEYGPEIMLFVTAGMPAYMRYLLWTDPSGKDAEEFKATIKNAQNGAVE